MVRDMNSGGIRALTQNVRPDGFAPGCTNDR
jgi:hypothetical protein